MAGAAPLTTINPEKIAAAGFPATMGKRAIVLSSKADVLKSWLGQRNACIPDGIC